MYMRENRRKSGTPQPEQVEKADVPRQRAARKLSPNGELPSSGEDCRFTPDMSNPAAINDAHYASGLEKLGPFTRSYEDKIPYVGVQPAPKGPGRDLKV